MRYCCVDNFIVRFWIIAGIVTLSLLGCEKDTSQSNSQTNGSSMTTPDSNSPKGVNVKGKVRVNRAVGVDVDVDVENGVRVNVDTDTGGAMKVIGKINVQSSAFENGQRIPTRFTGEGENISPPLSWSDVPEGTKELALIVDDPDAPLAEPFVHWVIYKIPANVRELKQDIPDMPTLSSPNGALQGKNSSGGIGYIGPMPPKGHGVHHYHFKLYALDESLDLDPGMDKKSLLAAIKDHVLAEGELIGTYQR